jgi:hypothetical protein
VSAERLRSIQRAWPHIRAALVLLHIVAVVLLSLPHPSLILDRSRWRSGRGRMELANWTRTFNRLGFDVTEAELERKAWAAGERYRAWFSRYVHPFERYATYLHTRQGWSMFTHPKKRIGKVWIEIELKPGVFWPVFVSKSPVFVWNQGALTHNRMRKLFNRVTSHRYKGGFDEFALWVAPKLARAYPASRRARVSIENYVTPPPERVRAGEIPRSTFTRRKLVELEALR